MTDDELRAALLKATADLEDLQRKARALSQAGHPNLAAPVEARVADLQRRVALYGQAVGL